MMGNPRMRRPFVLLILVLAAVVELASGIGCRAKDRLNTVVATGVVTFRGKPVDGAIISFSPRTAGIRSAIGTTDSNGRFHLMTLYRDDGAMPGTYAVTIIKAAPDAASAASIDTSYEATLERSKKMPPPSGSGSGVKAEIGPESLLPAKYKDTATSGLTAEIKPQGENHFSFDLTE